MAPDAPAPVYDSHGNQVSAWYVRMEYDPIRDRLVVSWQIHPGPYNKGSSGVKDWEPVDLEDALSDLQRAARICGARRLF